MRIKDFVLENWRLYPLQIIGIALLILAGVFGLFCQFGVGWICFGIAGGITAFCAARDKWFESTKTVSQVIQDLTTKKLIDYIVGVATIAIAIWQHLSIFEKIETADFTNFELAMITAYWPLVIGLAFHFFANKD